MGILESFILGLVQGLAEFLPISSSGHLVIFQAFMGLNDAAQNVIFDIFLHIATTLAVIWVYRRNLAEILKGKLVGETDNQIPASKLIGLILISILATGVIYPFKDSVEGYFENVNGVRVLMIINAIALGVLPLFRKGSAGLGSLGWTGAIVIGLAQAIGAFPGISRSGSTILAGLLLGLKPSEACRYSFLLAIPTIIIAAITQIPDAIDQGFSMGFPEAATGFITALVFGLMAIPLLVGLVEKGRLWGFSIYCGLVGIGLFFVTPAINSTIH